MRCDNAWKIETCHVNQVKEGVKCRKKCLKNLHKID
jgi:hypothetical protein